MRRSKERFRRLSWLIGGALVALAFLALALRPPQPGRAQSEEASIFMPSLWRSVELRQLPPAATSRPSATVTASATPTNTLVPTITPIPSFTPTVQRDTGTIKGRIVLKGAPLADGYGAAGLPQIELRKGEGFGPDSELVANSIIQGGNGEFVFENPPPLPAGERYHVRFDNPPLFGFDGMVGRWWSKEIDAFGNGETIDVGTFDVTNLTYDSPCHDCLVSPPITFKWNRRNNPGDRHRWAVFDGCGELNNRYRAFITGSLGRDTTYITGPPSGFRLNQRYCWYVLIDDGENGTGWPFYDWRVTWLAQ